ncbi:MAG: hypothetical protein ACRDRL_25885, partial [Sciscionella sp.]
AGSVGAEYLSRLEPLGNFAVLCGLLAHFRASHGHDRRQYLLCGVAFGAAASVKIWWAIPLLIVLVWHLYGDARRDAVKVVAGAAIALLAINAPFVLAAPNQMWHMVVTEQLGRNRSHVSVAGRMGGLTGLHYVAAHQVLAIVVAAALLVVTGCVVATVRRMRAARLVVTLALAQGLVLMAAPSWFSFYADYLAPAAALSIAAGLTGWTRSTSATAHRPGPVRRLRPIVWGLVAAIASASCAILVTGPHHSVNPFPSARLSSAARHTRCVMSDSPMGLILLDALSRDLSEGCQNWVDVTGRTYGVDTGDRPGRTSLTRVANPKWQHDLLAYLRSGDAVLLIRVAGTGVTHQTLAALQRGGVLAAADGYVIYRTPHGEPSRGR